MQMLIDALASAAIIAPAAIGFTLIYTLFRYANFAAGGFVTGLPSVVDVKSDEDRKNR